MKPVIKRILIIISAAVAAVLVAVLTLSLITVRPIARLGEYKNVYVLEYYDKTWRNEEKVKDGIKTVKFSVMRSLLEGQAGYKIKPVTIKDADDEDIQVKYNVETFTDIRPRNGEFMIKLEYGESLTNKRFTDDDGNLIMYNTVVLIIPASEDKITDVRLYPYLEGNMTNSSGLDEVNDQGEIDKIYYNIYEFTAKMYTHEFYEVLEEFYEPGKGEAVA